MSFICLKIRLPLHNLIYNPSTQCVWQLLNRVSFVLQVSCVSPEGSLSLLIPVQLAPTVQVEKTAVSRLYPAHLETCAHLDLKNWYPAFQGATRIYLDR